MHRFVHKQLHQYTACIMAALMLLVLLYASSFIPAHIHHDCSGEDCPVCACIQHCENTLRAFGSNTQGGLILLIPVLLILLCISLPAVFFTEDTPVSDKVRLNN